MREWYIFSRMEYHTRKGLIRYAVFLPELRAICCLTCMTDEMPSSVTGQYRTVYRWTWGVHSGQNRYRMLSGWRIRWIRTSHRVNKHFPWYAPPRFPRHIHAEIGSEIQSQMSRQIQVILWAKSRYLTKRSRRAQLSREGGLPVMMKSKGKMLMRALRSRRLLCRRGSKALHRTQDDKSGDRRCSQYRQRHVQLRCFSAQYTGIFKTATGQISTVSSETASESMPDYLDFSGSPIEEVGQHGWGRENNRVYNDGSADSGIKE